MAQLPWFRMYSEFAHDPKVQRLSEVEQRRFVMMLCLRCSNGVVTLHDSDVAFQLRISDDEWTTTKAALIEKNLIGQDNKPISWEKRQYKSDSSAERVEKHRAAQKLDGGGNVTLPKRTGNGLDTDIDSDSEGNSFPASGAGRVACPHKEIIDLYSQHLPTLPGIKVWNEKRRKLLSARWRENEKRQSLEYWEGLFQYIAKSDFLTGRTSDWQADLEWILNSSNFVKVIEGKYENRKVA